MHAALNFLLGRLHQSQMRADTMLEGTCVAGDGRQEAGVESVGFHTGTQTALAGETGGKRQSKPPRLILDSRVLYLLYAPLLRHVTHIPPNLVVRSFRRALIPSRGQDLQVEHPVGCGYSSALDFHPT
jgi:hypothetical protein